MKEEGFGLFSQLIPGFLPILLGPTASGKEEIAIECARILGGEILSVDSMKLYRTLDIGTAKPSLPLREEIPHHGIDWVDPTESYSVARWVQRAKTIIENAQKRGKILILSGGTALYYKGLLEGLFPGPSAQPEIRNRLQREAKEKGVSYLYGRLLQEDPQSASRIHPHDLRRIIRALEVKEVSGESISQKQIQWKGLLSSTAESKKEKTEYTFSMVGLWWSKEDLFFRIDRRIDRMMEAGLLEEARRVFDNRDSLAPAPLQAVGYKEFFPFFRGEETLEAGIERLRKNTRKLVKSQMTWFKKFPCYWIHRNLEDVLLEIAKQVIQVWNRSAYEKADSCPH